MLLAVLARADAVLLLVLPIVAGARAGRAAGRLLAGLALLGAVALGAMVVFGGDWAFRPADGGHLLRLLLVPWGPPLPMVAAAAAGLLGAFLCLAGGRLLLVAAPRVAAFLLAGGAVAVAGSLVDWTAAGRYVLMPAVLLALAVGAWWEGAGRTEGARTPASGPARRDPRLAHRLGGGDRPVGLPRNCTRQRRRNRALQCPACRTVAAGRTPDGPQPAAGGLDGGAADFENVASAATRRPVRWRSAAATATPCPTPRPCGATGPGSSGPAVNRTLRSGITVTARRRFG